MTSAKLKNRAHVIPFFLFLGILFLGDLVVKMGLYMDNVSEPWYRRRPEYLVMLLQLLVIFPLLIYWRKGIEWKVDRTWIIGVVVGFVGIGLWILPSCVYGVYDLAQEGGDPSYYKWLGLVDRSEGFDAKIFQNEPINYWLAIVLRFIRAVVLVSIIEEVFWRGFLMRFVTNPGGNYWKVPFGQANWKSYLATTAGFMLVHQQVDYLGAFLFGTLMFFVAVRTKSLFACIAMHALANFILGVYALSTGQFGMW